MSKLDELVKAVQTKPGTDGCYDEVDIASLIRAYIEERFGPLMRNEESNIVVLEQEGCPASAALTRIALARAKEE